jgi:hypothetical protein
VPFLRPKEFTAVGISHHTAEARGYRLFAETRKTHSRSRRAGVRMIDDNSQQLRNVAAELGITWSDGSCARITTNVYATFHLCLARIAAPP